MQKHPIHKNTSGFTLLEMLIAIAIIGILAVVVIPKYNQYKIRGYDAHSKQALRDMHMLCKAYWLESSPLQECRLPIIKKAAYGFNQNPEVMANLPSPTADNFCASAKHNESPNTYSIDRASEINAGEKCAGSVSNESVSEEPVQIASVPEPALLAAVEPSKAEQAAAEKAAQAEAARISANAPLIVQRRRGGCPLGWSEKGSWCVAEPNAPAILSDGEGNPCPSGWTKEKRFCVEGPNAPSAVLMNPTVSNSCPPGWTKHAKFCIKDD
jgi:prepilin-type N-terminal cleavage/methylation domain-containing protein